MEFQMDILFFNGTSALDKVSKVINIAKSDLVDPADPNVRKVVSLNVMIETWDERSMGDTWKYVGTELDPGTVTLKLQRLLQNLEQILNLILV